MGPNIAACLKKVMTIEAFLNCFRKQTHISIASPLRSINNSLVRLYPLCYTCKYELHNMPNWSCDAWTVAIQILRCGLTWASTSKNTSDLKLSTLRSWSNTTEQISKQLSKVKRTQPRDITRHNSATRTTNDKERHATHIAFVCLCVYLPFYFSTYIWMILQNDYMCM